jgi:hypothetical protein
MKRLWLLTTLIGFAVAALSSARCAAQQETGSYLYYQASSGQQTRYPARTSGSESLAPLPPPCPQPYGPQPAAPFVVTAAPQTCKIGGTTYSLAYVSVTGSQTGGITVFPDGNGNVASPIQVKLGQANINVNYVYFPTGGSPCPPHLLCPTGAAIDEFSETTGTLENDLFVTVYSPIGSTAQDLPLTSTGNDDGAVATTNGSVQISAYPDTPNGGIFDRWVTGPGGTVIAGTGNLDVGALTDDYALALYRAACPAQYYWSPTATISQCIPQPNCAPEVWNSATDQCQPVTTCPADCLYGCNKPQATPQGPVWTCKPAPVAVCSPAQASSGCGKGYYCAEPGEAIGQSLAKCRCLECASYGNSN